MFAELPASFWWVAVIASIATLGDMVTTWLLVVVYGFGHEVNPVANVLIERPWLFWTMGIGITVIPILVGAWVVAGDQEVFGIITAGAGASPHAMALGNNLRILWRNRERL